MGETPGQLLRRARKRSGMTLDELARVVGVSAATLSRAESGRGKLSPERLRLCAAAIGLDVEQVLSQGLESNGPNGADPQGTYVNSGRGAWRGFAPLSVHPALQAAIDLFVEVGYHGTSVRDIAARSQLSVPGLYHHYASKHDLLVAVMDFTMTDFEARCESSLADGSSARERFTNLTECYALFHSYRRELAFIGASEMRSLQQPHRDRIARIRRRCQRMLDHEVRALVDQGEASTMFAEDAARAVATMLVGIASWYRQEGPLTPEVVAARYVEHSAALIRLT